MLAIFAMAPLALWPLLLLAPKLRLRRSAVEASGRQRWRQPVRTGRGLCRRFTYSHTRGSRLASGTSERESATWIIGRSK